MLYEDNSEESIESPLMENEFSSRRDITNHPALYTLKSVCIFSALFSIHLPKCCQGELVLKSRASSSLRSCP